jgi:hypothetical protein
MSPNPNDLAKKTGKELKPRDILVWRWQGEADKYYEVVEAGVAVEPSLLSKLEGQKETNGVRVRELTPYGPIEGTIFFALSGGEAYDSFVAIIRSEERTDEPSHRER